MNVLAVLGTTLTTTASAAEARGSLDHALSAMVSMFGVAMVHALRALMPLALDAELESARR